MNVSGSVFVLNSTLEWLNGAQNSIFNIDIMDLFQWEIQEGNWQAMNQLEWDLVTKEIFVPYNNRYLITLMLGVEKEHRLNPGYRLHEALIRNMWPELLELPINPKKKGPKILLKKGKKLIKSILHKSGFSR